MYICVYVYVYACVCLCVCVREREKKGYNNEEGEMNGVLDHDSALSGYTGPGTTWANEMNFVINHAPGAGSIARPFDQHSSALQMDNGCPPNSDMAKYMLRYLKTPSLLYGLNVYWI